MMTALKFSPAVFACDVSALSDPALYSLASGLVTAERLKKAQRYRFEEDRRLSLGAELILRYALDRAGLCETPLEYTYGENEKPYLKKDGVYFSLSHSGKYALCALSECENGCDIEEIKPVNLNVAKRFFTREEYDMISSLSGENERNAVFYRCWTLKESFIKATGLGMRMPLNSFSVISENGEAQKQKFNSSTYYFNEFNEIDGYKCAVCSEKEQTFELSVKDIKEVINEVIR